MSSQLVWFELPAADPERSKRFFGELMGWRFESWGDESYSLVADANPGGALSTGDGHPVIYFSTDDIDAAVARIGELGGEAEPVRDVPGVGRMAACRDDQGTRFSLYQHAGEPGA